MPGKLSLPWVAAAGVLKYQYNCSMISRAVNKCALQCSSDLGYRHVAAMTVVQLHGSITAVVSFH